MPAFVRAVCAAGFVLFALAGALAPQAAHAYAVYGAIGDKYNALGGPGGVLGQPRSDEADAPHGGRFNDFEHGSIYWHPSIGAYAVWGAIRGKWWEVGGVNYGYPITDELPTPDGRGRFNHFRAIHLPGQPEASIYWTPQTGAHAVYGAIRQRWAEMGWERSELGYPTSSEHQDGQYRRVNFENGYIRWTAAGGPEVIKYGAGVKTEGAFGGLRVDGVAVAINGQRIAGNDWFLSENHLCGLWHGNRDQANEALKQMVRSTVNPRMGDFSIRSDARMNLTAACSARAEIMQACGNRISVRMALPRNLFLFHVTTPTFFGSWADPEFSIDWDMEARLDIELPQSPKAPLRVNRAALTVSNIKLDSQNVTGDVAKAIANVYSYFSGQDVTAQFTQDRTLAMDQVAVDAASLTPAVNQIPDGYRIENCVSGNTVVINGTNAPLQPGPVVR